MTPKARGFAAMDKERQRQIAREGGIAAHKKGTAHEFTSEEARAAGRAGGKASARAQALRSRANQPVAQSALDENKVEVETENLSADSKPETEFAAPNRNGEDGVDVRTQYDPAA